MTPKEQQDELRRLRAFANTMDSRYGIPGTSLRFGLDSIVGLIPGIGDGAMAITSLYIPLKARKMGVGFGTLAFMVINVFLDWLIGLIPLVGDVFDMFFNCNTKNVDLLEKALAEQNQNLT